MNLAQIWLAWTFGDALFALGAWLFGTPGFEAAERFLTAAYFRGSFALAVWWFIQRKAKAALDKDLAMLRAERDELLTQREQRGA